MHHLIRIELQVNAAKFLKCLAYEAMHLIPGPNVHITLNNGGAHMHIWFKS